MRMTLKQWGASDCPGRFTGPSFDCWRESSILDPLDPSEEIFHLVITSLNDRHPFQDKYASPFHQFTSFYGLRQYLGKPAAEIEGEVDLNAHPSLPPVVPSMTSTDSGFSVIVEQYASDIRDRTRRESLLLVQNHREASCGMPPHIDDTNGDQRLYYFERTHGNQLIFVYDQTSGVGRLYGGATDWERILPVVGGEAEGASLSLVEQSWLKVCWDAAIGA